MISIILVMNICGLLLSISRIKEHCTKIKEISMESKKEERRSGEMLD